MTDWQYLPLYRFGWIAIHGRRLPVLTEIPIQRPCPFTARALLMLGGR